MSLNHISETDIVRAANCIAARGRIPTIAAVRQLLDGRGSETTILNYLRKWKLRLLAFAVFCETNAIKPDLVLDLKDQNLQLQNSLQRQIAINNQLENEAAHYKTENIVLTHGVQRLNKQINGLQNTVKQLQTEILALEKINAANNIIGNLVDQKLLNSKLTSQLSEIRQQLQELVQSS
jgi:hypothetical protein